MRKPTGVEFILVYHLLKNGFFFTGGFFLKRFFSTQKERRDREARYRCRLCKRVTSEPRPVLLTGTLTQRGPLQSRSATSFSTLPMAMVLPDTQIKNSCHSMLFIKAKYFRISSGSFPSNLTFSHPHHVVGNLVLRRKSLVESLIDTETHLTR